MPSRLISLLPLISLSISYAFRVSLEDMFNGKTSKLQMRKNVICKKCSGQGGKSGAVVSCKTCSGRGVKVSIRQLGPGMVQQMQSVCPDCKGEGKFNIRPLPFIHSFIQSFIHSLVIPHSFVLHGLIKVK